MTETVRRAWVVAFSLMFVTALGIFASQQSRSRSSERCASSLVRARELRAAGELGASEQAWASQLGCGQSDDGRLERAEWLLASDRLADAELAFRAETRAQPERASVWTRYAHVLALLQQDEAAYAALGRALQLEPGQPLARQQLEQLQALQAVGGSGDAE